MKEIFHDNMERQRIAAKKRHKEEEEFYEKGEKTQLLEKQCRQDVMREGCWLNGRAELDACALVQLNPFPLHYQTVGGVFGSRNSSCVISLSF